MRTSLVRCTAPLFGCASRAGHGVVMSALACAVTLAALFPVGCAPMGSVPLDTGSVGVTAGGTEDIAQARSRSNAGGIPSPESVTVEGFLSEHDIPIPPPASPAEIYASVAGAWRPPFNEPAPMVDIFVGLGTTIDLDAYRRPSLNLAVVVDRSGSMEDPASASDYRLKMDAVKQALHSLVDRLTADDRLALVSFNERVRVDLASAAVTDPAKVHERIDALKPQGNTNLHEALRVGFEQVAAAGESTQARRVIVFTDALPTVGPTTSAEILDIVQANADRGIGFTLMGVGQQYGTDLAQDISNVRLGNAFFLSDADRIAQIFNDEFDFLVAPAAYDLTLEISIPESVGIRDVYGVPDYVPGSRGARVTVPTLFFSRREGGAIIVVRLTFAQTPDLSQDVVVGQLSMHYTLPDGTARQLGTELVLPAGQSPTGDPTYYSDPAARRAALLLDTALVLREAVDAAVEGRGSAAVEMLRGFLADFDKRSLGLSDRTDPSSRGLSDERDLLETLLGTLTRYPYGYIYYYP